MKFDQTSDDQKLLSWKELDDGLEQHQDELIIVTQLLREGIEYARRSDEFGRLRFVARSLEQMTESIQTLIEAVTVHVMRERTIERQAKEPRVEQAGAPEVPGALDRQGAATPPGAQSQTETPPMA